MSSTTCLIFYFKYIQYLIISPQYGEEHQLSVVLSTSLKLCQEALPGSRVQEAVLWQSDSLKHNEHTDWQFKGGSKWRRAFTKSWCYFDTCNVRNSLQLREFKQAAAAARQEAQNYRVEAIVQYFLGNTRITSFPK